MTVSTSVYKLHAVRAITLLFMLHCDHTNQYLTSKDDVLGHKCIHDEVAIPYDQLPAVDVTHELQTAYVAEVPLNPVGLGAENGSKQRKNVRFFIKYLLGSACKEVGMVVPTYLKEKTKVCTSDDILTKWKLRSIKVMMDAATKFLSSALLVDPLAAVQVPGGRCSSLDIPKMTVPNKDYVVFVTANPRPEQESTTVAWAAPCVREGRSGRPIVGHINFIPAAIKRNPSSLTEHVAMHELAHAIGFSDIAETVQRFTDGTVSPMGWRKVYREELGKTVTIITSSKVLEYARQYFDCPTLDGVEIEDAGSEGTRGSHWKKRILFNEALVGSVTSGNLFFSPLTLAYFEDLGFYTANYSAADKGMTWGKGRGCDFLYKRCNSNPQEWTEFCFRKDTLVSTCTLDRSSLGACDVTTHSSELPKIYRYFDDPRVGGSSAEMDYCPAVMGFVNTYCTVDLGFAFTNMFGNEMGIHSLCYDSNVIASMFPNFPFAARCFPTTCTPSGQLLLRVQGQTVECPPDGKAGLGNTSKLKGVHGRVECPRSENLCKNAANGMSVLHSAPAANDLDDKSRGQLSGPPLIIPQNEMWVGADAGGCSSRLACLEGAPPPFPACSLAARKIMECLGNDCPDGPRQWSRAREVRDACSKQEEMVHMCMEGWRGVNELCRVVAPDVKSSLTYEGPLPI